MNKRRNRPAGGGRYVAAACSKCTGPCKRRPNTDSSLCRHCQNGKQRQGRVGEPSTLKLDRLTPKEQEVYDAIMAGRSKNHENQRSALAMVERATINGTLAEELEDWTAAREPIPLQGSTAALAMRAARTI